MFSPRNLGNNAEVNAACIEAMKSAEDNLMLPYVKNNV